MAGMTLATAIIGASSAVLNGINSYSNFQAQAKAAGQNALIAENNASATRTTKSAAIDKMLTEGKQKISNQYVSQLVSGSAGAGTTGETALVKSSSNLAKDLSLVDYNYETKAIDYLNQAKMFEYEKDLNNKNATFALVAGGLNALNSVASVYSKDISGANTSTSGLSKDLATPKYYRNSKLFGPNY